jgi:sodium/hydrogen antiporter
MSLDFSESLLVLGALVAAAAALSGLFRGSILNASVLAVAAGVGLAAVNVVSVDAGSDTVEHAIELALILTLFSDGLVVERELLGKHWGPPARALIIAMPVTMGLIALCANVIFPTLDWVECFLLGAVLAPTDPVVTSTVVTARRVPGMVRHTLNLESGLNDGLALPAVLAFSAALRVGEDGFEWWKFVLQDVTLGFGFGIAMGYVASRLLPRHGIPDHQRALFALGAGFATYGVAVGLPPEGNGLIAVFVCAITLGIRRPDLRVTFEERADDIVEIVKLGVFVVFGALLTLDGLFGDGLAALAIVAVALLVARPVAVWTALIGTRTPADWTWFMAWFGPKGVATMTFSLLVLADRIPAGARLFNLAALCVFVSIIAHGLTDTPGAEWIARRTERAEAARRAARPAPAR